MYTSSEIVLTIIIWALTGAGLFFGSRAALRRRRTKNKREKMDSES